MSRPMPWSMTSTTHRKIGTNLKKANSIIIITFTEHLLYTKPSSKWFTSINSVNPHNDQKSVL